MTRSEELMKLREKLKRARATREEFKKESEKIGKE